MTAETFEAAKKARDALREKFKTLLEEYAPYPSWGIGWDDNKNLALHVGCHYRDMRQASKKRRQAISALLGTHFVFEGVSYPIQLRFGIVPRLL